MYSVTCNDAPSAALAGQGVVSRQLPQRITITQLEEQPWDILFVSERKSGFLSFVKRAGDIPAQPARCQSRKRSLPLAHHRPGPFPAVTFRVCFAQLSPMTQARLGSVLALLPSFSALKPPSRRPLGPRSNRGTGHP